MNKPAIFFAALIIFSSCKGPGSGPLVRNSSEKTETSQAMDKQATPARVTIEKIDVKVEPCKDCIKISDLLENKKSYSGKTIKITGQVTKFNPEIMGKNWIHIQDGSEFQGGFDLTITTDQKVSVGDIITFEGKISLDKDFGYGYFYNVLLEDGKPAL
jgi:hypothetical protein